MIDFTQDFELTFDYVESVLRTLPISYYTGRDVDVSLSKTPGTSTYNPKEDSVRVSYQNILAVMKNLKSSWTVESTLRAELYHEISHAMLTPDGLLGEAGLVSRNLKLGHDVLNIFEDERIETILKHTFYGVNFKESTIALNNWKGPIETPPKDALGAFYQIVRFRTDYVEGRKEYLQRVVDIITTYRRLNKFHANYADLERYAKDVAKLFWDIARDWMEKNEPEKLEGEAGGDPKPGSGSSGSGDTGTETDAGSEGSEGSGSGTGSVGPKYDPLPDGQKDGIVKTLVEKEAGKKGGPGTGTSSESGLGGTIVVTKTDVKGDSGPSIKIKGPHGPQTHVPGGGNDKPDEGGPEIELTPEQMEALLEAIEEIESEMEDERTDIKVQDILATELNKFVDDTLTAKMSDIFENFLSRNKNNSAAMHRYSGTLDPRLLATRDDWRIWKYKSTNGPIKGFDKLHLNLFIDTSGSYYNNEIKTNTILKSLDTLEHKYPFFSFDLVTCQISETLRNKKQRYIEAYGGNRLDDKIFKIYNDLQYHDSFNYNIVLFDGDAFTDCSWGSAEKMHKNFGAFNSSKCSIISDDDNEDAIKKYAPQAHSIFVKNAYRGGHSKSYADMLFDNILEAMNKALL